MSCGVKHYPIQFSIPTNRILEGEVDKEHCFSYISPGKTKYSFDSEDEYYRHYASCYFAVTREKSGWDSMRHYEILGSGSVPYFLDLENCPDNTLFRLPKKLLMSLRDFPGMPSYEEVVDHVERDDLENLSFDWDKFDMDKYFELLDELKSHTRDHLTTKSMAKYFMDKLPYDLERVLVVSSPDEYGVDYQRDSLITGLVEHGVEVYTTSDLWWMYEDLHWKQLRKIRRRFWGKGFTITQNISSREQLKLLEDYSTEVFDVIIMSSSSNMGYDDDQVRYAVKHSAERIVWLDGNDIDGNHEIPPMCGVTFTREMQ